jgi:Mannosyltransferase (PIG-V)
MSATVDHTHAAAGQGRQREGIGKVFRTPAFQDSWGAFWRSRVLVWVVGCLAYLTFGVQVVARNAFDPLHVTNSLGSLGNVLAAPAVRWDSIWYLRIADHGYRIKQDTGFFPLYPLVAHVGSWVTGSSILAGVLISMVATLVGLTIVHRLTELELGDQAASTTVKLIAFAPFAFYLSALYTEGLFLALSAGTFLAARRERWALAGILGGLAATVRVTGILLLVPVLLFYIASIRQRHGSPRVRELAWTLLIPAGLALFCAYTALRGFGFTASFSAQHNYWQHRFTGPLTGIWQGLEAAWHQLKALISGNLTANNRTPATLQVVVLGISIAGLVGVFRRLPPAYGVYVLLGLLAPLSSPTVGDPLRGLDRYASMMFPLFMWLGAWATGRRFERPLVIGFAVLLALFTIQFATWHLVGTIPS